MKAKLSYGFCHSARPNKMLAASIALVVGLAAPVVAQKSSANVYYPPSSIERPQDLGRFAHTNYVIHATNGALPAGAPAPPSTAETPDSLACVYGLLTGPAGCLIAGLYTHHLNGGFGTIALVDAYNNPTAATDLISFASQFGYPTPDFQVVKDTVSLGLGGTCTTVPDDVGWAGEEALDIEYAFAMAPKAHILLVEACSNSYADLMHAELVAGKFLNDGVLQGSPPVLVKGGDISNSWGGSEFSSIEQTYDPYFFNTCLMADSGCSSGYWDRIVYFASAGDDGCGAQWPSSSPWVVSAGGTKINRTGGRSGPFGSESCWNESGGGVSGFETWGAAFPVGMGPWVNFQYAQFGQTARQTPDIAADADPYSGAAVYCQYCFGGWEQIGGTSLASPLLAGVINIAYNKLGQKAHSGPATAQYTNEQNAFMYSELFTVATKSAHFYDVSTGTNGCPVSTGWDQCTGIGSPRGYSGH